jgi:hypothetical protein
VHPVGEGACFDDSILTPDDSGANGVLYFFR